MPVAVAGTALCADGFIARILAGRWLMALGAVVFYLQCAAARAVLRRAEIKVGATFKSSDEFHVYYRFPGVGNMILGFLIPKFHAQFKRQLRQGFVRSMAPSGIVIPMHGGVPVRMGAIAVELSAGFRAYIAGLEVLSVVDDLNPMPH